MCIYVYKHIYIYIYMYAHTHVANPHPPTNRLSLDLRKENACAVETKP